MRTVLPDLLRDAAASRADGVAVVDGHVSMTYAQLDDLSDRVAHLLVEFGVQRGDRVGLFMEKSANALVGLYGAMKAGAAYVPVDPQAPVRRASYILSNCDVRCVLTNLAMVATWSELCAGATSIEHIVALDAEDDDLVGAAPISLAGLDAIIAQPTGPPPLRLVDQDLAYILYTSGSTGEPKGVTLTHRNATAFVGWAVEEFGVTSDDRLASHAPLHFDLSIFDLYAASSAAAPLVLVPHRASVFPAEIAKFIRDQKITVWYSVPSILAMMTLRGGLVVGDLPSLRTMLFAGEVFPTKHLRTLKQLLPHARLANLYGPTETNVCTWYDVPELPDDMTEPIPIGRPVACDEVYVVDEQGALVAPGEVGELYVRGATVMRGYWADPERTSRTLIDDPFRAAFPDPVYRTGDLVREAPDGTLHYHGRRDAQIKSRGYRIELGEIETALNGHPDVTECAVIAVPDELVTNLIKAFVVSSAADRDLLAFCGERIPKYMLPHSFEHCDELPKTSTGKVDRIALATHASATLPPTSETEEHA